MSNQRAFVKARERAGRSKFHKSATKAGQGARKIARGPTYSRRAGEWKNLDTSLAPASIPHNASWNGCELDPATSLCLNACTQGATPNSRDGREIVAKSISVEGIIQQPHTTGAANLIARYVMVALVLDTRTGGSQLNSEDVYSNPSGDFAGAIAPLRKLEEGDRYRILGVKRVQLVPQAVDTNQCYNKAYFRFYRKLDMPFVFKANAGDVGDCADKSLHIIAVCDNQSGAAPNLCYNARFRWVG